MRQIYSRVLSGVLLGIVTILFSGRGLGYAFWIDDWQYFWVARQPLTYPTVFWLHPGTILEFYLLYPILGTDPRSWQILGIVLRWASSFAVLNLGRALTGSSAGGLSAGIAFASLPLGLFAVSYPSAHVVFITVLCTANAAAAFIRARRAGVGIPGSAYMWAAVGFLLDPMRVLAVSWIPFFFPGPKKNPGRPGARAYAVFTACAVYAVLAFLPAFRRWYADNLMSAGSDVYAKAVHMFSAVGTAATWFIVRGHSPVDVTIAMRDTGLAAVGFLVCIGACIAVVYAGRRGRTHPFVFGLVWLVSVVIVQWAAGPSVTQSVLNWYMAFASVGMAVMLADGYVRLRGSARIAAVVIYAVLAWTVTDRAFDTMDTFRQSNIVSHNQQTLLSRVRESTAVPIVLWDYSKNRLAGPDDYQNFVTFMRWQPGKTGMATFVTDPVSLYDFACRETGIGVVDPLRDISAFTVLPDGRIRDDTERVRTDMLSDSVVRRDCGSHGINIGYE